MAAVFCASLQAARNGLAQLCHAHALFARLVLRQRPGRGVTDAAAGADAAVAPEAIAPITSSFRTWPRLPEPAT